MINKLKEVSNKKYFHRIILSVIFVTLVVATLFIVLKYNVEGEKNLPFELSKITIISTGQGENKEALDTKWAFDLIQNNDIYVYIDKNEEYLDQEAIKSISVSNFEYQTIEQNNVKIYKPDSKEEQTIYINSEENIVDKIEYIGTQESDLKNLEISNQGGVIGFRISNEGIGEYKSDEDVINHEELLKKAGITSEILNIKLTCDFNINLENGNSYTTKLSLELPTGNVVEEGTTSIEITDVEKYIFKKVD